MQMSPCTKCGSVDVHYGKPVGPHGYLVTRFLKFYYDRLPLTYFVCCGCGHVEISMESEADRRKIASEWPKVR